jgi:hypothetical protein
MAYIKLLCAVARNRKFIKAGPAPAWLWVLGLMHCQESLTDGFIAEEALPYLGAKNAAQLADHLVKAGLWHKVDGGWEVHDYLEHNRSASQVAELKATKQTSGKLGGRPKKNHNGNHHGFDTENHIGNHEVSDTKTTPVVVVVDASEAVAAVDLAMDVCARELVNLAPPEGRCSWNLVERPLYKALTDQQLAATPAESWTLLKARLENHKRSHRWRVNGTVKRLDRWLSEGSYLQELPEESPATSATDKRPAWARKSAVQS